MEPISDLLTLILGGLLALLVSLFQSIKEGIQDLITFIIAAPLAFVYYLLFIILPLGAILWIYDKITGKIKEFLVRRKVKRVVRKYFRCRLKGFHHMYALRALLGNNLFAWRRLEDDINRPVAPIDTEFGQLTSAVVYMFKNIGLLHINITHEMIEKYSRVYGIVVTSKDE